MMRFALYRTRPPSGLALRRAARERVRLRFGAIGYAAAKIKLPGDDGITDGNLARPKGQTIRRVTAVVLRMI